MKGKREPHAISKEQAEAWERFRGIKGPDDLKPGKKRGLLALNWGD